MPIIMGASGSGKSTLMNITVILVTHEHDSAERRIPVPAVVPPLEESA